MSGYSEDLRRRIVSAVKRGMSKSQAARTFDVSLSSVKRYARIARQGESLTPKKSPGRTRKVDKNAQVLLKEDVKERPAATIGQRRRFLEHVTGKDLSDSTVRRLMKRLGFSQKKRMCGGAGTRRVPKSSLESDGCPTTRCSATGVRGRDGHEHLAFVTVCLGC